MPASLIAALRRGAMAVIHQPLAAAASFGGLTVLVVAGCLAPWANFIFILFGLAPLLGGVPALALALTRREPVGLGHLFRGFRTYERFLGLFWLGYLLLGFLAFPGLTALALGRHLPPALEVLAWGIGAAMALGGVIFVTARWLFVFLVAAEAPPEVSLDTVLTTAADLTDGHRWRCFAQGLACAGLALSGVALLGLGWLMTAPWAACALAELYEDAKGQRPQGSPWYPAPAPVHERDDDRTIR